MMKDFNDFINSITNEEFTKSIHKNLLKNHSEPVTNEEMVEFIMKATMAIQFDMLQRYHEWLNQ